PYAACFIVTVKDGVSLNLRQLDGAPDTAEAYSPLDFCRFLSDDRVDSVALGHNYCGWEIAKG
ncbi:MAG: hypothetical protein ACR2PS_06585, partial [Pseudomonadales bacterium]